VQFNDSCLKLGCLNIEKYRHFDRVIPALCENDLDVICLQEVPEDMVRRLEQALQASVYYVPLWSAWCEEHQEERPCGLAVFIRKGTAVHYDQFFYHTASASDHQFMHNRILQYVTIEKDDVTYRVGHTHFTWTPDGKPTFAQYKDMRALFDVIDAHLLDNDLILCGDFNAPRGGPIWKKLSSRFRDNIPPLVVTTLDQEYHRAAPIFLVVDGMFASPHYSVRDVDLISGLSDHLLIAGKVVRVLY
jgi:endonuclease/exonuclease/phosphatase family metal-dependent hydrolase